MGVLTVKFASYFLPLCRFFSLAFLYSEVLRFGISQLQKSLQESILLWNSALADRNFRFSVWPSLGAVKFSGKVCYPKGFPNAELESIRVFGVVNLRPFETDLTAIEISGPFLRNRQQTGDGIGCKMLDVLVISPHPDDAELGMGGAILRFKAEGWRVGILDLTDGEPTPYGSPELRGQETEEATRVLGIDWRDNLGLPNRSLEPTLEARAKLAGVIRRLRPRWIFAPYWEDAHPDHVAATQLIEASRFWAKLTKANLDGEPHHPERIFYYYCIHLRIIPQPAFILDITPYWERKLEAIRCYRSQFLVGARQEPPTFLEKFQAQAATWGWAIGVAYGEPFASREPLGLTSLRDLI